MRSIPLAMTWEMLRRGRWGLLAAALGANLLPAILLTALRYDGALVRGDPSQIVIHVALVQINMFLFAAAVFAAQGHPSRLYAFPVPTSQLVAWHLLPAMAAVAIESLASTAALNAVFDLGWPLWGPALFVAVALVWVQAACWLTEKTAWLVVAMTLVAVFFGLWLKSRYGPIFSQPSHYWTQVTPMEVATMLALAMAAYATAVVGVGRNRRGQPLRSFGIVAWLGRVFEGSPRDGLCFRTPAQAQLWFEWQKKGWFIPGMVVFCIFVGFGAWLTFSRRADDLCGGFVVGGGLLSLMGLIAGMIIGNVGPNDENFEIGSFLATRPMTSAHLAQSILKTAAKSVLMAWFIWAGAFLALYLLLLAIDAVPRLNLPTELGWRYLPATLLGSWVVVATAASIGLTGRSRPFVEVLLLSFASFVVVSLFSKYALSPQARQQLVHGAAYAAAAAMALGTAWAFAAALRRSLVRRRTVYLACAAWASLASLVALERASHTIAPPHIDAFVLGIAALVVAP
ncbi:MAG TPA: hypothetical protein VGX76_17565, partial [Pirellulales bacterium]|nr:hypothetical protein [Pirellulales bacterium]